MFPSVCFMYDISKTTKRILIKVDRKLRRGQRFQIGDFLLIGWRFSNGWGFNNYMNYSLESKY